MPKPDDKYIKRVKGGLHIDGSYINGRFSAMDGDLVTEEFKRDTQHADILKSWDLIKTKEERANFRLNPNPLWNVITMGVVGLVLIVGLVMVTNMVSDSNTRITNMNKDILKMQTTIQQQNLEFLKNQESALNRITTKVETIAQKGSATTQINSPPPDTQNKKGDSQ